MNKASKRSRNEWHKHTKRQRQHKAEQERSAPAAKAPSEMTLDEFEVWRSGESNAAGHLHAGTFDPTAESLFALLLGGRRRRGINAR